MKANSLFYYSNFFKNVSDLSNLFEDCVYPWEALEKIKDFIKDFEGTGYTKRSGVYIGRNVKIDKTAKVEGAAIIGHNSTIGHAAYLRAGVLLGESVHVGHATEVKHSIILSNTALAHLNYIGDSIVGSGVNISGGAVLANWRLDKNEIIIKNGDEKIETHMQKMGSIVGDRSFIGVNSVLNPGTILACESIVYPLVSVKGTHLSPRIHK